MCRLVDCWLLKVHLQIFHAFFCGCLDKIEILQYFVGLSFICDRGEMERLNPTKIFEYSIKKALSTLTAFCMFLFYARIQLNMLTLDFLLAFKFYEDKRKHKSRQVSSTISMKPICHVYRNKKTDMLWYEYVYMSCFVSLLISRLPCLSIFPFRLALSFLSLPLPSKTYKFQHVQISTDYPNDFKNGHVSRPKGKL